MNIFHFIVKIVNPIASLIASLIIIVVFLIFLFSIIDDKRRERGQKEEKIKSQIGVIKSIKFICNSNEEITILEIAKQG